MGIGFTIVFPLTFVASTFVPIAGLPDGLEQFAEWNPISALAAAAREQFGNPTAIPHDPAWPLAHPALYSLLFCAAILAVVVPLHDPANAAITACGGAARDHAATASGVRHRTREQEETSREATSAQQSADRAEALAARGPDD